MAGSGEVERAVTRSSEVEGEVARPGEREPLISMDYPCTARLRLRRLFAYLRGHGNGELYQAARRIMPVIFHTKDLAKKVKEGQWREATSYRNSFAPFSESGYEAKFLMQFLVDFMAMDLFARNGCIPPGGYFWKWFKSMYRKPVLDKYPCLATLLEAVISEREDNARDCFDWQLVRNKAAKVAEEMAYKTPELRGNMVYPRGRSDLYHVMPIGSRYRVKKNFVRKHSAAVAQCYPQMKNRLPSSSQGTNHNDSTAELAMLHGECPQKVLHGERLMELFDIDISGSR